VRVIPLGGVGEIGKNMYVVECGDRMVVIDCGVTFPTPDQLGVDLVLPDFSYVRDRADRLEAVILTHGHEDHIGAVPYLLRETGHVPVLGTRFTLGLVRGKLDEHRLLAGAELVEVRAGDPARRLGPFAVEFLQVTHSIPDCVAVVLDTPAGRVVHTGDFKFDHTPVAGPRSDVAGLARLGERGVTLLLSDSTNAEVPGMVRSERTVGEEFRRVFATARGRVIVTTFASHVHRMQQVLHAAYADGRVVAAIGRSMTRNLNIARNLGYIEVPDQTLVSPKEIDRHPPDEQVLLSTGSQGEPLSALRRMALGTHPLIQVKPGDTVVFSSRTVPGNELAVNETINRLEQVGAKVVTQESNPAIHVSGHGRAEDLVWMLQLVRPRFFAPIHGEFRHQRAHRELATGLGIDRRDVFILANGDVLEVGEDQATVLDRVESGITYVDSFGTSDVGEGVLRDRRHLSEDGLVLVITTVDAREGTLCGDPDVVTRGFGAADDQELIEMIRLEVQRSVEASARERVTEVDLLQRQVHDAVAGLLYKRTRQRPVILPVVVEV
jgi:ribonuclease J